MRRSAAFVVLSVLLAACGGGEGSVFTAPPTTAGTSTSAGATTTSGPGTTAATSPTPPAGGAEVVVWQILQRWDGALPLGSFEATVCNLGQVPAGGLEAVLAANGVEARVTLPEVPARGCVDAYDPASTFETFGVTEGQTVTVRAAVSGVGAEVAFREEAITVGRLSAAPTPELLAACAGREPVAYCVPGNAVAVFAEPHEVMKQRERYAAVVPADWEPLAAMAVADMTICLPRLEGYLGMLLPGNNTPLMWRFAESADLYWFRSGNGITEIQLASTRFYEGVLSGQFAQHSWEWAFAGLCAEAHETTHVILDDLMGLPHWLDEGLATYLTDRGRTNWYVDSPTYRCEASGYVDINPFTGEETLVPYVALEPDPPPGISFSDYYVTGACFWEYFESTFGHDLLLDVMDTLEQTREVPGGPFPGCPRFLDLVAPIIGEGISALTQERFGFGPSYARCTLGG